LFEIFVSAREGVSAEQLLEVVDAELDRVLLEPVSEDELLRATARIELSLLQGLSNNEGKASTIGFYEVVLGNPIAGFERLSALPSLRPADLTAAAQRYLKRSARTVILVRPQADPAESGLDDDPDDDEPITTRRGVGVPA
jgi:zinc protease